MKPSIVIGIDFGTSNSYVSVWRSDKGRAKIIKNNQNPARKVTPSIISFRSIGFTEPTIGAEAVSSETKANIVGLKNVVGLKNKHLPHLQSKIVPKFVQNVIESSFDEEEDVLVLAYDSFGNKREFHPEELTAMILSYLRDCAKKYLVSKPLKNASGSAILRDDPVSRVVIGVPAQFPECSRQALRQAAHLAGFDDVHFMIESTAAAMAYGLLVAGEKSVLVFDMGGGTTDISILHFTEGNHDVQFTAGQNNLGGQNIDLLLLEHVKGKILSLNPSAVLSEDDEYILQRYCRTCKEHLTTEDNYLFESTWTKAQFQVEGVSVTRREFEGLMKDVCRHVQLIVIDAIQHWKCQQKENVKKTNMALNSSGDCNLDSSSDDSFSNGFVRVAHSPCTSDGSPEINAPESSVLVEQGTVTLDEIVLVGGCSRIPCIQQSIRDACAAVGMTRFNRPRHEGGVDLCMSINPEHAVAEGLAIRGAVISGIIDNNDSTSDAPSAVHRLKNLLMLDSLPTTLGVLAWSPEDGTKFFQPILQRGQRLPCVARHSFQLHAGDGDGGKSFGRSNQRHIVSLDIYEEIEEVAARSSTISAVWESGTSTVAEEANKAIVKEYTYHLLRTVDVPIMRLDNLVNESAQVNQPDQPHAITVVFRVNDEGILSYEVEYDTLRPDASSDGILSDSGHVFQDKSRSNVQPDNQRQMFILIMYVIALALMYIFVKIFVLPTSVSVESNGDIEVAPLISKHSDL